MLREGCTTAPRAPVEGTGTRLLDSLRSQLSSMQWHSWVVPLLCLIGLCGIGAWFRSCLCNSKRARRVSYGLSTMMLLVGILTLVGSAYLYVEHAQFVAFVNLPTLYTLAALSAVVCLFNMAMLVSLAWRAECLLYLGAWVLLLLILVEVVGIFIIAYWIYSLGGVPSDALVAMLGEAHRHVDTFLSAIFSRPVALAEGLVCKTYQACCRDDAFAIIERAIEDSEAIVDGVDADAEGTGSGESTSGEVLVRVVLSSVNATTHCLAPAQHEGATTDIELSLRDPSTENFCSYTSGAPKSLLLTPPPAACQLVQAYARADGFSLEECRANFCREGTDGYLSFLRMFTELVRRYAEPLAAAASVLVVVQLVLAVNLRTAAKVAGKRRAPDKGGRRDVEMGRRGPRPYGKAAHDESHAVFHTHL